ncbi:hypothetical protein [Mucilaginibacter sp. SG564]|uniref:hypothetical protein n=1 Tax=unclassified Mucilaginibacter TaxID=2617802 RepID=UPI001553EA58|nr:hypothetical protein [Mucilaginibacter sp. SG564]NOW93419.1 hypothetical protein [Mucilaginibacter sp. SG564]
MKSLKPNFIGAFHGVLICTILIIGACKKDKKSPVPEPAKTLFGSWSVTIPDANFSRSLNFGSDGTFSTTLSYYDKGQISYTVYTGTYLTKGDSLKVTIKEMTQQDPNKPSVKTASNIKLYDNSTFKLDGNLLTLKYITYPADSPVVTETKFYRQLPD